ncbi:TolC family outer membrane protein [Roseospirillum parvum]|uniref:Outer membrane protein n=1 Tax=Roseospirillum parvum TaxID=83401 RepID=A0A1G8E5Q1_9PROT|nr:TolC family outer membrane protein [Roseospirillum parvum]SDH65276.1 outer membrane protein [Roseospirillum parvum]
MPPVAKTPSPRRRLLARTLPVLLGLAVAAPQPALAETLEEALIAAYQGNPALEASRAELRAVDENVPQALAGWRPDVTLSGGLSRTWRTSNQSAKYTDNYTGRTLSAEVTQNLFDGFQTTYGVEEAEFTVMAQRYRLLSVEQDVLLEAVQAYLDVVRDIAVVELNTNNEQVLRRQLEATQDRFRVGEITRTDVSQAEARLAGAIADRIQAEGNLQSSRATYQRVIGHPPESLEATRPVNGLPKDLEAAIELALTGAPAVRAADYTARAAEANIEQTKGQLLPSLDVSASVSRGLHTTAPDSMSEDAQIAATLTVPLYQGGGVYSQLRQAKHTAGQRRIQVEEARQSARETVATAWDNLSTAQARIKSIRAQIEAAEIALEGVQREAQVGSRTVLDVLDAEQELLNARVDLVEAQRDEALTSFQLLSAIGRMTAAGLGLGTGLYDPGQHYDEVRDQWFGGNVEADKDSRWMPQNGDK